MEIVVAVEEAAGAAAENGVVAQCRIALEAGGSATFHVGLVRMTLDEADWSLEKPCYYYLA